MERVTRTAEELPEDSRDRERHRRQRIKTQAKRESQAVGVERHLNPCQKGSSPQHYLLSNTELREFAQ